LSRGIRKTSFFIEILKLYQTEGGPSGTRDLRIARDEGFSSAR